MTTPHETAGFHKLGGELEVSRIGYGSMKLTGWPSGSRPERQTAVEVLRRAVELGVNHIDTCHYYSKDGVAANALIHQALHPYPEGLVIATKVGPILEGEETLAPGSRRGLTPEGLRWAVEANLQGLGLERLDLVNLRMDPKVTPEEGSLESALETLAQLQQEGLVRHLGISNITLDDFHRARTIVPIVCVQNKYNVSDRRDEKLVDTCAEAGIAYVPFFPVSGFTPEIEAKVSTVASRHQATVPQVALAWLLQRSPSILLIPGTGSVAHLEENIAAGSLRLNARDLAELG